MEHRILVMPFYTVVRMVKPPRVLANTVPEKADFFCRLKWTWTKPKVKLLTPPKPALTVLSSLHGYLR